MGWPIASWGRKCKLGWGYNRSLNQLIPVKGNPINVKTELMNSWGYFPFNSSSNTIVDWVCCAFVYYFDF